MKKILIASALLIVFTLYFTGCSEDSVLNNNGGNNDPNLSGLMKIDSSYATGSGAIVALYASDSLKTGYNKLYVVLYDSASGTLITDAHVSLMPEMDMGMMVHSAPYENPAGETAIEGKYPGAVVFIMPSTAMMPWTLNVMVHNHSASGEPEGTATFNLVVSDNPTKFKSIMTGDSTRLYLSYIQPKNPIVGINDFEFSLHKRETMMSFPADSSYTCTIYPWMPSMGHGSPNNVDPVHVGMGHYNGDVNFTMTGDWQIKVYLHKNGQTDSTYFDLLF
ncbi:MAG: FixH family protein [Ignavibacteria bacterium]|nr:FixH family protein [Ignavibacteria bacterium]